MTGNGVEIGQLRVEDVRRYLLTVAGDETSRSCCCLVRPEMRAGEVAGLTLDDIDWRSGEITTHSARADEAVPPHDDVG